MEISLLTIGNELLNGDLTDTNTSAICRALSSNSLTVKEALTVGDLEDDIVAALQRLSRGNDVVIVTGGLGPTADDRTAKAAAVAFDKQLTLNDKALRQIRSRFRIMRREMHPANEKQAMLPSRSSVIENRNGTAPGFQLRQNDAEMYFMPGVPAEMLAMLNQYVVPNILDQTQDLPFLCRRDITIFGLPEPEVEDRLEKGLLPNEIELGFNVNFPFVVIKLSASGEQAQRQIDSAELTVRKVLGDYVIGTGTDTLESVTAKYLTMTELTLAMAESCTGGLIAKLLTDQAGASTFLERSFVTYANTAKTDCLNVPNMLIERHGAVSAECASAMARGAKAVARSDVALSVTGIAGPEGGTDEKPVGTVFISIVGPGVDRTEVFHFPGNRNQVRIRTAYTALDWLRRYAITLLGKKGPEC